MPALPAADCALYRGGPREAPRVSRLGILGPAGAFVRRFARGIADCGPGARRARFQSHGPHAPPGNKPTREEIANCRPYLERELDLLRNVKVVVALGRVAFDNYLGILQKRGLIRSRAAFAFGHNRMFETAPGQPALIASYHPSQQNTSTGKLTEEMLAAVFRRARKIVEAT